MAVGGAGATSVCVLVRDADKSAVIGTLKGYDQLMNLVLDEVKEAMTGEQLLGGREATS